MTKYLVKIISICSFIVLIPVIIAGVALSAIGSTLFNVDLFVLVEQAAASQNVKSDLYLYEKGTDPTKQSSARFLNGTELNVNLDLVGYDFLGWFEGDAQSIDKTDPVCRDINYPFTLSKNTQLTALLTVKQYDLTFENIGENVSISLNGVGKTNDEINSTYQYDSKLPVLTMNNGNDQFYGWRTNVKGVETLIGVNDTIKLEESGAYTLTPAWSDRMTISYLAQNAQGEWKEFYAQPVTEDDFNSFAHLSENQDATIQTKIKNAVGKGYQFDGEWMLAPNGKAVTAEEVKAQGFEDGKTIKIYLKKSLITYTINVKKSDNPVVGENVQTINFDVENGFGDVTLERNYYTFVGLTALGKDYTLKDGEYVNGNENLRTAILDDTQHADHTFDAVAIWECEYNNISFYYSAVRAYDTSNLDPNPVFVKVDGEWVELDGLEDVEDEYATATFNFNHTENAQSLYNMEDEMFKAVFGIAIEGSEFAYMDYATGQYVPAKLVEIDIYNGMSNKLPTLPEEQIHANFAKLFGLLLDRGLSKDQIANNNVRIEFRFEANGQPPIAA